MKQLSIIERIIEKKYEYRQDFWQIFVDFRKAYNSIHRESLYNMEEFGIPNKLMSLTRLCMEETKCHVRVVDYLRFSQ